LLKLVFISLSPLIPRGEILYLACEVCIREIYARDNKEKLSFAREIVLAYSSILRARQTLQKIRFGNRVCEQDGMTFEVTDASFGVATCQAYARVQ
jgi:hypothetical protein